MAITGTADADGDVQRLEAERLRPVPPGPDHYEPVDVLFTRLLDLISAECRRAGMLPGGRT